MSKRTVYFGCLPKYEPETTAYLTDVGISDNSTVYFTGTPQEAAGSDIWTAVDTFVVSLKSIFSLTNKVQNLDTIFGFIYLFLGTTATMAKYNLAKSTSFAGSFVGGVTIDSSGITGNGTNGYFNTTASQSTMTPVSAADESYGFWSKTNASGNYCDLGSIDNTAGAQHEVQMIARNASGNFRTRLGTSGVVDDTAVADSLGFFSMSRTNTSNYKVFKNGSVVTTHTRTSNAGDNVDPVYILANDTDGSANLYSVHKLTFAYASKGISDANMASFYTAISTLQTALGR